MRLSQRREPEQEQTAEQRQGQEQTAGAGSGLSFLLLPSAPALFLPLLRGLLAFERRLI